MYNDFVGPPTPKKNFWFRHCRYRLGTDYPYVHCSRYNVYCQLSSFVRFTYCTFSVTTHYLDTDL